MIYFLATYRSSGSDGSTTGVFFAAAVVVATFFLVTGAATGAAASSPESSSAAKKLVDWNHTIHNHTGRHKTEVDEPVSHVHKHTGT